MFVRMKTPDLPDDIEKLKAVIADRDEAIAAKDHTIAILSRIAFGKKSERRQRAGLPSEAIGQGHLFHAELIAEAKRFTFTRLTRGGAQNTLEDFLPETF